MSNSIDQRIVQMQFDNSQFQRGVSTTLESLKNLGKSLEFKNSAKGIKDIESSINKLDFSSAQSCIDTLNSRFTLLGETVANVKGRIANMIADTGQNILRGITIDPLMDGMQEYSTKLGSIQTILTNTGWEKGGKGRSIEDVTAALDNLNDYADKTIYNFSEMTRNIGTFTAAGVDLDSATTAIKGIANVAASSGATSQQASMAMYQLSQALSSGVVRLQDWVSVVNSGMGGKLFQDALKMTNEAMVNTGRTAVSAAEAIEKTGSFRESLAEKWLTSANLTETLENFTRFNSDMTEAEEQKQRAQLKSLGYSEAQVDTIKKQSIEAYEAATKVKEFSQLIDTTKEALGSGWATTWELIIGDLKQARALWTPIADFIQGIVNESADARNNMLRAWSKSEDKHIQSGRDALAKGILLMGKALIIMMKPISNALKNVFGDLNADALIAFSYAVRDLAKNFLNFVKKSEAAKAAAKGLEIIFTILFSVIKAIGILLGGTFMVIVTAIGLAFQTLGLIVQGIADAITNFVVNTVNGIGNVVAIFKEFGNAITEQTGISELGGIVVAIGRFIDSFVKAVTGKVSWDQVAEKIGLIAQRFGYLGEMIAPIVGEKIKQIADFFNMLKDNAIMAGGMAIGAVALAIMKLGEVLTPVAQAIGNFFSIVGNTIGSSRLFENIGSSINVLRMMIARTFSTIEDLGNPATIGKVANHVRAALLVFFSNIGGSFSAFFYQLRENLGLGSNTQAGKIIDSVINFVGQIKSAFEPIIGFLTSIGDSLGKSVSLEGIMSVVGKAQTILSEGIASVTDITNPEQMQKLGESIKNALKAVFDGIGSTIKNFFGNLKSSLNLGDAGIFDAIFGGLGNFAGHMGKVLEPIKSFFGGLMFDDADFAGIGAFMSSIVNMFKGSDGAQAVANMEILGDVAEAGDKVKDKVASLGDIFSSGFSAIGSGIGDFVNGFADGVNVFIDRLDTDKMKRFISVLSSLGISIGVIGGLYNISKGLKGLSGAFGSIGKILEGVVSFIKPVRKLLEQSRKNMEAARIRMLAESIKMIAISIAIIAGSIIALTYIDHGKMMEAIPILGGIIVVVALLPTLFARLATLETFNFAAMSSIGAGILAFSLSIAIAIGALVFLSNAITLINVKGIGALAIIIGAFIGVAKLMEKIEVKNLNRLASAMRTMSSSLIIMWVAIELLGHMDSKVLMKGVGVIGGLMIFIGIMGALLSVGSGMSGRANMIKGLEKIMGSIAGMVIVCALAIKLLSGIDPSAMSQAVQALEDIMAMIAIMSIVMLVISAVGQGTDMAASVKSLLALTLAVAVFAGAIAALALVSSMGGDIGGATLAIAIALVALAGACFVISKAAGQMTLGAAGIIAIAAAIGVLVIMVLALSSLDISVIGNGLLNLAAILGVAAVALLAFGFIGEVVGGGLVALALAFIGFGVGAAIFGVAALLIAGAIYIATAAMAVFTEIAPNFIPAFQAFAQSLIAMFSQDDFVGTMIGFSLALTLLGAASLVAAVGVGALGLVVKFLPDVFTTLAKDVLVSIKVMADGISGMTGTISSAVTSLLEGVVGGIANFAGNALQAGMQFAKNIGEGLKGFDWGGAARNAVVTLGGALMDALQVLVFELPGFLLDIGGGIVDGVGELLKSPLEQLGDWLHDVTGVGMDRDEIHDNTKEAVLASGEGITEAREQMNEDIRDSYNETDQAVQEGSDQVITSVDDAKQKLTDKMSELGTGGEGMGMDASGIMQMIGIDPNNLDGAKDQIMSKLDEIGVDIPSGLTESISSAANPDDLMGALTGNLDPSTLQSAFGDVFSNAGLGDAMEQGFASSLSTADLTKILDANGAIDVASLKAKFDDAASQAGTSFNTTLQNSIHPNLSSKMNEAVNQVQSKSAAFRSAATNDGRSVTSGFKSGASGMGAAGRSAAQSAVSSVSSQSHSASSAGYTVGSNIGQGLINGMKAKESAVYQQGYRLGQKAVQGQKDGAATKSPSRIAIQTGKFIGEGLLIGIKSMRDSIYNAGYDTGNSAVTSIMDATAGIAGFMDDIDDNPTIRPVLDLTDYEAGIRRMQGLDVSDQTVSAQWANRVGGRGNQNGYYNNSSQSNVNIVLDWKAGTTPNQMVQEMANVLQTKNLMEA